MAIPINTFQGQINELNLLGTTEHNILEVENVNGEEFLVTKPQKWWFVRLWNWITGKTAKNEERVSQVVLRIFQDNVRSLEEIPLETIDKIHSFCGYRHHETFEDIKNLHHLYTEIPNLQRRFRVFQEEDHPLLRRIEEIRSSVFRSNFLELRHTLLIPFGDLSALVQEKERDLKRRRSILSGLHEQCQKLSKIAPSFIELEERIEREKNSPVIATLDVLIDQVNRALDAFVADQGFRIIWGEQSFYMHEQSVAKSPFFSNMLENRESRELDLSTTFYFIPSKELGNFQGRPRTQSLRLWKDCTITPKDLGLYIDYLNDPACPSRLNEQERVNLRRIQGLFGLYELPPQTEALKALEEKSDLEKWCQKLREIEPFAKLEAEIRREKQSSRILPDALIEEVGQALRAFEAQKDVKIILGERTFYTASTALKQSQFFLTMLEEGELFSTMLEENEAKE